MKALKLDYPVTHIASDGNQAFVKHNLALRCSQCSLGNLCLPVGLNDNDMSRLDTVIDVGNRYRPGEHPYEAGEPFDQIYAVKSGAFKTVTSDANGEEHIVGFHLPGELFGLDAIYPGKYSSTPVAVTDSIACRIDYNELSKVAADIPTLQQQLLNLMSKEVFQCQKSLVDLTAEQKLAGFIMGLSSRYQLRGYSSTQFQLLMPRKDIANHLGMAPETVSRMFKRLVNEQILDIDQTEVTILDPQKLKQLLGVCA